MMDELDWTEKTADIPAGGAEREREATASERQTVAGALGILEVSRLHVRYRLSAIAGDAYYLTGTLIADVEQACIVSLEPVADKIDTRFDVEFRPDAGLEGNDEEASILQGPDTEPLECGIVPVGRIVFETLSGSLDPYPRREGAVFTWQDPRASDPEKASPFAALAALKNKG